MKTLKLNALEKETMTNREMQQLVGGERACVCACQYRNQGGSSQMDNGNANYNIGDKGGYSTVKEAKEIYDDHHNRG